MKQCPKCSSSHSKPGKFCSRTCANSRNFTEESKRKRANTFSIWYNSLSIEERKNYNFKKTSPEIIAKRKETFEKKWREKSWDELPHKKKKEIIVKEQKGACLGCYLSDWMDKPLTLELDHIDGNNKNNVKENLRALCPNCHSQTPTWRKGWKNYVKD